MEAAHLIALCFGIGMILLLTLYQYHQYRKSTTMLMQLRTQTGSIRGVERQHRLLCPNRAHTMLAHETKMAHGTKQRGVLYQNHIRALMTFRPCP